MKCDLVFYTWFQKVTPFSHRVIEIKQNNDI